MRLDIHKTFFISATNMKMSRKFEITDYQVFIITDNQIKQIIFMLFILTL